MPEIGRAIIDVVVLAAGINTIPLFDGCKAGYKALLPLGGKPALIYTLDALLSSDCVGHICIAGPPDRIGPLIDADPLFRERCDVVPGGESLLESVRAGLARFPGENHILVTTADLPLLTAEAVSDFLRSCSTVRLQHPHSLWLSVVPDSAFTGAYSAADKMFSRFRDVAVCQGNLVLVDPWILHDPRTAARIDKVYAARKGRLRSAMAFGWRIGLSYVFGVALCPLLSMNGLARLVSKRFGFGIVPIVCHHPEIAVDIDEPADYAFVTERLGFHSGTSTGCANDGTGIATTCG